MLHLIKLRASQINGCGEPDQKLYELNAWEEALFDSDRERAALAWTEAVTRVAESRVPDEVYEEVRQQFSGKDLARKTV